MSIEGMRNLCFSPKSSSSSSFSTSHFPSPFRFGSRPSFSESITDKTLETAEPMIMKWNPDSTTIAKVTSLFYENRKEAWDFIKAVNNLQKAMHLVAGDSNSEKLTRCQMLMQIAMKRLQKEFYQILSINRAHLDPESVSTRSSFISTRSSTSDYDDEDDDKIVIESISEVEDASSVAMTDLKLIAECMISSGYAKECMKIYKIIRKSIVDEGIYRLGVEKFSASQIHKMNWNALDLRINHWINAVKIAVKTLFNGERILCDHVFACSDSIRESCFTEISKDGAMILFGFPENVMKNSKKSPDKLFRVLDMYTGISNHWPEIDFIFSFDSTASVKSQALTSLVRLGEYVRTALNEFESTIQKDSSKSPVVGAGIHHLTIDVMNYLSILADYSTILSDILAESPQHQKNSLPEKSLFGFSDAEESPMPAISLKVAWLILVLLCKLDIKAEYYKDISFSYLFLANNLQYIVARVRTSNLKYLLGEEWLSKHESKVKLFSSTYERLGWGHVIDSLPKNPTVGTSPDKIKEVFKKFSSSFDQAYQKYSMCIIPDRELLDDIKTSIGEKIAPVYREFYNAHSAMVRRKRNLTCMIKFAPEDVENHLSNLFFWNN
ncbi:exocyst complex component EXO70A1-like [Olea europaea subsp. europaea]|uniref:Exocyst subunit Exo70 family protein n=1 Tax=Olea europaea subsp. europaea TaxID=158383 RepID=A0A8S0Q3F6_OLEEU|nr:exocyst complex component EXO70A1-like [Olea europaea subsp. europaea]